MIPKIIHFVWIGEPMPEWASGNIDEFRRLNPGHEIRIHGADVLLPEFAEQYHHAVDNSSRADMLRYSALTRFGGWYADVDFWPLRPLDDAERAWGLDGSKVFLARQSGNTNNRHSISNGVIATDKDAPGLARIVGVARSRHATTRTSFGPETVLEAFDSMPSEFVVSDAAWWFPLSTGNAAFVYPYLRVGELGTLARSGGTGGQLPFAAHLWAHGRSDQLALAWDTPADMAQFAVVARAARADHPLNAIAVGLNNAGFRVIRPDRLNELFGLHIPPSVAVAWNGKKDPALFDYARSIGTPTLYLEHGFFRRRQYTQVDHSGFLHWASWRESLGATPPVGAESRLAEFYPYGTKRVCSRQDGYVLVLGQVAGDTQLDASEIKGPVPLQRVIHTVIQDIDVEFFFRPHPYAEKITPNHMHRSLPRMPQSSAGNESSVYAKTQQGVGLDEAMAGARFVIAINSNALNEALAAGIPAMAFGPFLGIDAGAVKPTSVATLRADIDAMLAGWTPDQLAVDRYLQWLAARQWTNEELENPDVLRPLLAAAGVGS